MKYIYNKLVRDKIPENIHSIKGRKAVWRVMTDEEYIKELNRKLLEDHMNLLKKILLKN